jgi:hypothetical protein
MMLQSMISTFALLMILLIGALPESALAQQEVLPKGIGTFRFGQRSFSSQTQKYNSNGELEPLGQPFNKKFSGQALARGEGGAELTRLATELQKFDSYADNPDSLLNQLDLGTMSGQIAADVNAKIFSTAYGLTDRLSLFLGIPYTEAEVRAKIDFARGSGGTEAVRQQLGNAGFDQLLAGLVQASNISSEQILSEIEAKGYAPINHWSNAGLADIQAGAIYSATTKLNRSNALMSTLRVTVNVPTGYVDDPDILTDFSIGKGYWGLNNEFSQKFVWRDSLWLGLSAAYGFNFDTVIAKRIPEANEGIIAPERRIDAELNPGDDIATKAQIGASFSIFKSTYALGSKRHFSDSYAGSLAGNYGALGAGSSQYQLFHEVGLQLQTADLYQRKQFMIPITLDISAHLPIAAINSMDERYIQIEIGSFFATPASKKSSPKSNRSAH